ncbi:TlpA family protein disulfide reductase [Motilibacter aurantiacus]|uniref:TlpA family protein disulfide reductase n=1 Tax=Motilibacter aurantiacus TaxID=2714955 RepID=UPI0014078305|nr:redoxin domain-containing protein [Motilibacter aurantiacus]
MSRRPLLLLALGAALVLPGCGGSAEPAPGAAGTAAAEAAVPGAVSSPPAPGDVPAGTEGTAGDALDFAATTLDGAPFSGASLRGRPAALWFWAPWCPTCLRQAPAVREAVAAHPEVNIVGVAGLDSAENLPGFVDMAKVSSIPHLSDEPGEIWKRFEVAEQSTFVLLDVTGQVVFRGPLEPDEIAGRLARLAG